MRVLILNQFFYPDRAATSQMMTDLAEDLAQQGVEVTAVAGRESYLGGTRLPAAEDYNGVRIVRVRSTRFDRASMVRRVLAYVSFYWAAFFRILFLPRQDVLIVLTTPPLIAVVGSLLKFLSRCRLVYLVQDLYPDVAVHLGLLGPKSVSTRLLEKLSRFALHSSDAVIALGECMRRRIEAKGVRRRKIHVIQNWADSTQLRSVPREQNPFRRENSLDQKFVVLYSGNLGKAHDLDTILASAEELRGNPEILFLFIVEGPKKKDVMEFARSRSLGNIGLLPYRAREELSFSLSAGDASLVSLLAEMEGLVVPSKLYGIMAVGRPVIYIGPRTSEVALAIEEAGCGFVAENGDSAAVAKAILSCFANPALSRQLGQNARTALERRFDRRLQTRRYYDLLAELCGNAAGRPAEDERQEPARAWSRHSSD